MRTHHSPAVLPGLAKKGQHEGWGVCSDGVCVSVWGVGVMEVVVMMVGGWGGVGGG